MRYPVFLLSSYRDFMSLSIHHHLHIRVCRFSHADQVLYARNLESLESIILFKKQTCYRRNIYSNICPCTASVISLPDSNHLCGVTCP
ncbi:hypothetical protein GDO86_004845 [Hymenochirus boettgeri]|uniref:Uncharacterized protein n=1 Tax=Hymenochirus boettgeri TaxID=247094 RepID=A0A8T2KEX5_9PIPI|nr:hypothetical protein GDO86_004845 [Hymenochirus boettgeri]